MCAEVCPGRPGAVGEWFWDTQNASEDISNQKLGLQFSQEESLGLGCSETIPSQTPELFSPREVLGLGHTTMIHGASLAPQVGQGWVI